MKVPLILTPRQYRNSVSVSAQIVDNLQPYHIDGIRYMYQQLFIKGHNIILNNEPDINEARQIGALLSAIDNSRPSLVFCKRESLSKWYYEFVHCSNLKVATVDTFLEESSEIIAEHFDAILVAEDQLKHFKTIPVDKWFLFIVDNIDLMIKARYIKTTDAQFRVGITSHNFLMKSDIDLQWNILKWMNPKFDSDKNTFIETEHLKITNLLRPYPENWRRLTWFTIGKQKPTDSEILTYDMLVRDWCNKNNMAVDSAIFDRKRRTPGTKKRTATRNNSKERPPNKKLYKREIRPILTNVKNDITLKVIHKPQKKEKMSVTEIMNDILNVCTEEENKTNRNNNISIKDDDSFDTSVEETNPLLNLQFLNIEDKAKHKTIIEPKGNQKSKTINIKVNTSINLDTSDEEENLISNSLVSNIENKQTNINKVETNSFNKTKINNDANSIDEEENPILNSLFFDDVKIENKTSKHNESITNYSNKKPINKTEYNPKFNSVTLEDSDKIKEELTDTDKSFPTKDNVKEDSNWILDSLLDSPEPLPSKREPEKDDTEDSCAILDSLFFS